MLREGKQVWTPPQVFEMRDDARCVSDTYASESELTVVPNIATALLDATGRITYVDPVMERITGYPAERFILEDPFELVHPEDRDFVMRIVEGSLMTLEVELSGRFRIVRPNGESRWFEMQCRNLANDPTVGGLLLQICDVTDQFGARFSLRSD